MKKTIKLTLLGRLAFWCSGWVRLSEGVCMILSFGSFVPSWGLKAAEFFKSIVDNVSRGKSNGGVIPKAGIAMLKPLTGRLYETARENNLGVICTVFCNEERKAATTMANITPRDIKETTVEILKISQIDVMKFGADLVARALGLGEADATIIAASIPHPGKEAS